MFPLIAPKTDEFRQRNIRKLFIAANELERGTPISVTKLRPIERLTDNEVQCQAFFLYLVKRSFERFQRGESLSTVTLIAPEEKAQMYTTTIGELTEVYARDPLNVFEPLAELDDLEQRLWEISPGWARMWLRATRRKLADPDLLLLEAAIRLTKEARFTRHSPHTLSQMYCCDYHRYRFKLTGGSAVRIRDIATYFTDQRISASD
jgi:hypothetical protein